MLILQNRTLVQIVASCCLMFLVAPISASEETTDVFEPLYSGTATQAVGILQARVAAGAGDAEQFALGIAQTCSAIEHMTASFNRYGLNSKMTDNLRMLGMPTVVVKNPAEDMIDAHQFRKVLDRFYQDINTAQQTLEAIEPDDNLKIVFDITRVRLDYNGDGEAGPDEALGRLMQRVQQMQRDQRAEMMRSMGYDHLVDEVPEPEEVQPFLIALDAGDVYWLRGYCHVLMGVADFILAHDTDEIFNHTAHLFFGRVDTPYKILSEGQQESDDWTSQILDAVAFIHLIKLDVVEPQRMTDSLAHLRQVSVLSRQSWEAILSETDNDREWIPGPTQESVLGSALQLDQDRLDTWMLFLDEYDAIFAGKKLIPFWRGDKSHNMGVNLAKVFEDPQTFDLILWIQGSAAIPYLEQGDFTTPEFWRQLQRAFRGDFMSFAVIVN